MPQPLPDQVYPALKGLGTAHPFNRIHQWLCNALGSHPDQLVVTDPVQQLQVTVDIRPLIRILGGEWEAMLQRAVATKDQNSSGASKRGIQTEGEEGNFLASLGKLTGKKSAPPEGAKPFTRSADIAMDVNAKAAEAEKAVTEAETVRIEKAKTSGVFIVEPLPKVTLQHKGAIAKCSCGCNVFFHLPNGRVECTGCGFNEQPPAGIDLVPVPNGDGI